MEPRPERSDHLFGAQLLLPVWQLGRNYGGCVWQTCVCVCVCVSATLSRMCITFVCPMVVQLMNT